MSFYYKYLKYKQKYLHLSKGGTKRRNPSSKRSNPSSKISKPRVKRLYRGYGYLDRPLSNNVVPDNNLYYFSFILPYGYGVSYPFNADNTIYDIYKKISNHLPKITIEEINIFDSKDDILPLSDTLIKNTTLKHQDSLSVKIK